VKLGYDVPREAVKVEMGPPTARRGRKSASPLSRTDRARELALIWERKNR
jgi:hypothetical protein